MKIVISLGGNALHRRGQRLDADIQRENVAHAAEIIAAIARQHKVVVTYENRAQVALLAQQGESSALVEPYPLDLLDAESEGMIGYLIEQELRNRLPQHQIVTLLTQTVVNADDPAFERPSAQVGPAYSDDRAQWLKKEHGWQLVADGRQWRRIVPAPEPQRILELRTIRLLVAAGALVICAGGGGIPVVISDSGAARGVDAVVDKDLAAALLARELAADALLLLTDVEAAMRDWGTARPQPIREAIPDELRQWRFATESMGPKVEAACRFVEAGGGFAGIGRLEDGAAILAGLRGTIVRDARTSLDFVEPAKTRAG